MQFIYKRYINYHFSLHLGPFVICFSLLHTKIEGTCVMRVDIRGGVGAAKSIMPGPSSKIIQIGDA